MEERFVTVAIADTNGMLRGQKIAAEDLCGILERGVGMSPVQLALDPTDEIMDMPGVTDDQGDFHDVMLKVDAQSRREIPWECDTDNALYLAQFTGDAEAFCPRSLLGRVLARAQSMGFLPKLGFELEFTLFDETPDTLAEKDFQDLRTATRHRSHDLILYQVAQADFYKGVADFCGPLQISLCKMHEEIGGGFMEACIRANAALAAADQAILLRNFLRVFAMRRNQTICFMPRWSEEADSQSTHIHISLLREDGSPCFRDEHEPHGISETFRHFLGGLQAYLPDMMLILAPTVNSWRRFAEGTFAPPAFTWGVENRTTALRVVGHCQSSMRVENRLPCSDANPYFAAAATIAAGMAGVENKVGPTEATTGNGYAPGVGKGLALKPGMASAIEALRASDIAREWLSSRFVETFTSTRTAQLAQFEGKSLIDERRRFFELG